MNLIVSVRERQPLVDGQRRLILRGSVRPKLAPGDPIDFLSGGVMFAATPCTFRATLAISPAGLHRVFDPRSTIDGEGLHNLCQAAEQGAANADLHLEALAAMVGFASWEALAKAHPPKAGDTRALREVIGFGPLVADKIAAA